MDDFKSSQLNQLCLITGASKGIGKELANFFASKGYDLLLTALPNDGLLALKEELLGKYKTSVECREIDFNNTEEVLAFSKILNNYNVKILINNAGIIYRNLFDEDPQIIKKLLEVNFFAHYYITQAVSVTMKKNKYGYIFNIASGCAKRARPALGMYAISKYSLIGLNEALYEEMMKDGIKVTALCPSVVNTSFYNNPDILDDDKIQTDDIIKVVDFLLSVGKNAYIKEVIVDCRSAYLNKL